MLVTSITEGKELVHKADGVRHIPRLRRLVWGLLRVSQTRGYSGCRPISRGPDWWAALYLMEGRIVGDPVHQKETSEDLASPPRNT